MERGHADAAVQAGELYLLKHPTAEDTFSGYGLTLRPGRTNHLAGLLMVDRPVPVDRRWLAEVEEDCDYVYSKHLAHDEEMRRGLHGLVERAKEYWSALPEGEQDFDRAKVQFQRRFPL